MPDMELVMPFVACQSEGGPYDDAAFAAGYQAGQIDTALAAMRAVGATEAHFTVRTALVPQIDLIAMRHGYATTAEPWMDSPDDWSFVTISPADVQEGTDG